MLLLSRFLQRFQKSEKQQRNIIDGDVPLFGDKGKPLRCKIHLLDDTEYIVDIKSGSKGQLLVDKVCEFLNLLEKDYFGLRYLDHVNQTQWLDPTKSIGGQLKNLPPHSFYFGVKFYAADPCKLHEEITRYQFFLQVKRDVLQGRLPCPFDLAAELSALAVQSELGDYDPKRYSYGYVSEFRFVPNQTEEFENKVTQLHRTLTGQVPATAEFRFLDKVKWLEMYGVDLHPVLGEGGLEYFLCLTPTGVVVYRNKHKVGNYFWPRITKITFKNKMFMIRVKDKNNEESTYAFECSNKSACKHLWKCCVEHHAFFRLSTSEGYSGNGKLFNLGSKYRYSGRTEKQVLADLSNRPAPAVVRTPSKRHQRRASTGENIPEVSSHGQSNHSEHIVKQEPVKIRHQHSSSHRREQGYQSAPESPRSSRSAPWTTKGGLFTTGCPDSPNSVHSAKLFPNRRAPSESESESVVSHRHRSRRVESESENEASYRVKQHRSRRSRSAHRCPAETDGSESESGHRLRMRKYRKSAENLTHSEATWANVQSRIRDANNAGPYPLRTTLGSMSSMASEQSAASKKARRRRSRSPGQKQPPAELAQHFKYVDPASEGLDPAELRNMDLQFTTVETNVNPIKISAKQRQRSRERRSYGEFGDPPGAAAAAAPPPPVPPLPAGEPPPPYTDPYSPQRPASHSYSQPDTASRSHYSTMSSAHVEDKMRSPVSVQINATHTAPIVKTKPVAMVTPPPQQQPMPPQPQVSVPTTQIIYGYSGNSAVVSNNTSAFYPIHNQQTQQQTSVSSSKLGSHHRDDSGLSLGLESPHGSNSSPSSVKDAPTSSQLTVHTLSSSQPHAGYTSDGGSRYLTCRRGNQQQYHNNPASNANYHTNTHQASSSSHQAPPTYNNNNGAPYIEQVSSENGRYYSSSSSRLAVANAGGGGGYSGGYNAPNPTKYKTGATKHRSGATATQYAPASGHRAYNGYSQHAAYGGGGHSEKMTEL